jgi:hypothetical protein
MNLPPEDDPDAIFAFAMSFDGYQHHGSLEASAEAARKAERNTLAALRNELFFSARASRARDDDRYLETYREILPLLRRY